MDYAALIPLAAFFVAVRLAGRTNTHPILVTSIAVLVPFIVTLAIQSIIQSSGNAFNLLNLFSVSSIVIVLLQFCAGVFIFKKIHDEDGLGATVAWSVGGFALIVFAIPYLVGIVTSML